MDNLTSVVLIIENANLEMHFKKKKKKNQKLNNEISYINRNYLIWNSSSTQSVLRCKQISKTKKQEKSTKCWIGIIKMLSMLAVSVVSVIKSVK